MKTSTLLGIGLGSVALVAIASSISNQHNRAIHLSQTQIANNAGLVLYNEEFYAVDDLLQQTSDIALSAYEVQQEIAANSRTGQTLELAINQVNRLTATQPVNA